MISDKMTSLLTEQMHREYESAYLYLSVANYYENYGLSGFANWFKIQVQEEMSHAKFIYEYLHLNEAKICFRDIKIVCTKFKNLKEPLTEAANHEEFITKSIENIYNTAVEERDYGTMVFLEWFITEQQEEEHIAKEMVQKYELYGSHASGLFALNREYGKRSFNNSGKQINKECCYE